MGSDKMSAVVLLVTLMMISAGVDATLRVDYYAKCCPNVEKIVYREMREAYQKDRGVAPGVLRVHFHDCFVRVSTKHACDSKLFFTSLSVLTCFTKVNLLIQDLSAMNRLRFCRHVSSVSPNTVFLTQSLRFGSVRFGSNGSISFLRASLEHKKVAGRGLVYSEKRKGKGLHTMQLKNAYVDRMKYMILMEQINS